jgi:RimJ/RimL family protein N-acetyltransferase
MGIPQLTTERLLLRGWREADEAAFGVINADPRVMEYIGAPLDAAGNAAFLARIRRHWQERGFGLWALASRDDSRLLGFVGLSVPRFAAAFTPCVEIGWRLAADVWGRGYAPEAAQRVVSYAREVLQLAEIVSFTVVHNQRSQRVMQKLGMRRDAADDFRHPLLDAADRLAPHVLYRLALNAKDPSSCG